MNAFVKTSVVNVELEATKFSVSDPGENQSGVMKIEPAGRDKGLLATTIEGKARLIGRWSADGLTFSMACEGVSLELLTQNVDDIAMLARLSPRDQVQPLAAEWKDDAIVVERTQPLPPPAPASPEGAKQDPPANEPTADDQELARLLSLDDAELETLAAERGVTWAHNASKETRAKKLLKAAKVGE